MTTVYKTRCVGPSYTNFRSVVSSRPSGPSLHADTKKCNNPGMKRTLTAVAVSVFLRSHLHSGDEYEYRFGEPTERRYTVKVEPRLRTLHGAMFLRTELEAECV